MCQWSDIWEKLTPLERHEDQFGETLWLIKNQYVLREALPNNNPKKWPFNTKFKEYTRVAQWRALNKKREEELRLEF